MKIETCELCGQNKSVGTSDAERFEKVIGRKSDLAFEHCVGCGSAYSVETIEGMEQCDEYEPSMIKAAKFAAHVAAIHAALDEANEGVTRCFCGTKYWEGNRCVDCGTHVTTVPDFIDIKEYESL